MDEGGCTPSPQSAYSEPHSTEWSGTCLPLGQFPQRLCALHFLWCVMFPELEKKRKKSRINMKEMQEGNTVTAAAAIYTGNQSEGRYWLCETCTHTRFKMNEWQSMYSRNMLVFPAWRSFCMFKCHSTWTFSGNIRYCWDERERTQSTDADIIWVWACGDAQRVEPPGIPTSIISQHKGHRTSVWVCLLWNAVDCGPALLCAISLYGLWKPLMERI